MLLAALISAQAQRCISIITPQTLLDTSITAITIKDVQNLLGQACGCEVTVNDYAAKVLIQLPSINPAKAAELNSFAKQVNYPYRNYPEHNYKWEQTADHGQIMLQLTAASWQGVSFGLYGLLQEKLGFKFYHPRNTIIPHFTEWPIKEPFTFEGKPLFDKKGFHLHTQHGIELMMQLHDPNMPNSLEDVKQYIDWLARNGQTYFEFCLLESIDRKAWPAHAKNIVDYVHARGLLAAVDLSLHMIQQKTFQLYKGPVNKKKQIEKSLTWLMHANWDFINMEFNTAEFISGNLGKKTELRMFILKWMLDNSKAKLMGRQHIVKHENEIGKKHKDFEWDSTTLALDKQRGVLAHTVMFYDMTEPNAPVYENKNQRHMFQFLLDQMKVRETWYYPESAYWITFDNSVPMSLFPYLNARLSDIDTCVKYGVPGHITFSSGWEWNHWLFDWSIARWSWQYTTNGVAQKRTPAMYADELTESKKMQSLFQQALDLQQHYLKDSTLMKWMTAMTITDEIGIKALNDEYHPRPQWSYKFLERKAGADVLDSVRNEILPLLKHFAAKSLDIATQMHQLPMDSITQEWLDGIEITGLRAQHRYYTLQYILARRQAKLDKQKCNCDSLLDNAAQIRAKAQAIVNERQTHYRYPVSLIAAKRWDYTSYHFGYLWPASNLHFWYREEQEARKNKYSPWFMNIWNVGRISGFIN